MNFFKRLTGIGKATVIIILVAIIGAVLYFTGALNSIAKHGKKGGYDAVIAVNTYCGFEPIVYANGGLEGTEDSYLYKKYGLKFKVLIMDDFDAARAGLKDGSIDIEYCTLDALPTEMSSSGTMWRSG